MSSCFFFFSQFWYFITTGSFFSHKCKMQFLKQHGCRWRAGVDVLRIHAVWISSADSCLGLICFGGKIDGVGGGENMQFCFSLSVSSESKPCVAEKKKKTPSQVDFWSKDELPSNNTQSLCGQIIFPLIDLTWTVLLIMLIQHVFTQLCIFYICT